MVVFILDVLMVNKKSCLDGFANWRTSNPADYHSGFKIVYITGRSGCPSRPGSP
jgi:hypothetical protein